MSKIEYWRESLGNAIPNVALTDKQIEDIMSIAEMESEYCNIHQATLGVFDMCRDKRCRE